MVYIIVALLLIFIIGTAYLLLECISRVHIWLRGDVPCVYNDRDTAIAGLKLANLDENSVLCDLGCGDGRVLRIALQEFDVKKAYGYEIDPFQALKARTRLLLARFPREKWDVFTANLLEANLDNANAFFIYLHPTFLDTFMNEIYPNLPKNSKLISCRYPLPDVAHVDKVDVPGKYPFYLYQL